MKQFVLPILVAAMCVVASCSKSDLALETSGDEMSLSPVSYKSSTKAAIQNNVFPKTDHISLFAYHNPAKKPTTEEITDFTGYVSYLNDTEFFYNTESPNDKEGTIAWTGLNSVYYWPITGSLVFAGYSLPSPKDKNGNILQEGAKETSGKIGNAKYDLAADVLQIENYVQSANTAETFDLLYFGCDRKSYNNRREGTAVAIIFNHALAWVTFNVAGGSGALMDGHVWKITNLTLKDVQTKGDFTYDGNPDEGEKSVTWNLKDVKANMKFFEGTQELTDELAKIENVNGGNVVIPQAPTLLSVTIEYKAPAGTLITETFDIDLSLGEGVIWEAGKHYVYNLTFSPVEIKVAPEVNAWPTTGEDGYVETDKLF